MVEQHKKALEKQLWNIANSLRNTRFCTRLIGSYFSPCFQPQNGHLQKGGSKTAMTFLSNAYELLQ